MTAPTPYFHFRGEARAALTHYANVFGCGVELHTFDEFGRTDGPADAVAHGVLVDGPVPVLAPAVTDAEPSFRSQGVMYALLGAAGPATLSRWFRSLADGGRVVD